MNTLKAKLMMLFLALAILTALPAQLRADGNPFPICGPNGCVAVN